MGVLWTLSCAQGWHAWGDARGEGIEPEPATLRASSSLHSQPCQLTTARKLSCLPPFTTLVTRRICAAGRAGSKAKVAHARRTAGRAAGMRNQPSRACRRCICWLAYLHDALLEAIVLLVLLLLILRCSACARERAGSR